MDYFVNIRTIIAIKLKALFSNVLNIKQIKFNTFILFWYVYWKNFQKTIKYKMNKKMEI